MPSKNEFASDLFVALIAGGALLPANYETSKAAQIEADRIDERNKRATYFYRQWSEVYRPKLVAALTYPPVSNPKRRLTETERRQLSLNFHGPAVEDASGFLAVLGQALSSGFVDLADLGFMQEDAKTFRPLFDILRLTATGQQRADAEAALITLDALASGSRFKPLQIVQRSAPPLYASGGFRLTFEVWNGNDVPAVAPFYEIAGQIVVGDVAIIPPNTSCVVNVVAGCFDLAAVRFASPDDVQRAARERQLSR